MEPRKRVGPNDDLCVLFYSLSIGVGLGPRELDAVVCDVSAVLGARHTSRFVDDFESTREIKNLNFSLRRPRSAFAASSRGRENRSSTGI